MPKIEVSPRFAGNRILESLSPEIIKRLAPDLKLVSLVLSQTIYAAGGPPDAVYFPLDGVVLSVLTSLKDGKTVEVSLIGSEGLLGISALFGEKASLNSVIVQAPGKCWLIKTSVLGKEFEKSGDLQHRILRYTGFLLTQISQTVACNRVHRLEQRLARWLLMVQYRVGRSDFPMTHDFLSHMLGTPRSEITLAAGILRDAGYIKYARGKLTVVDKKGLESRACECYQIAMDGLTHPL